MIDATPDNRVRLFRQEAMLSGAELARRLGVARPTLAQIELGHRRAWPKLRAGIARELGIPESRLFPGPAVR